MRRPCTITALALALTLSAAARALAFQEMPVPPPSRPNAPTPGPKAPNLAVGPPSALNNAKEEGGIHVFGYTVLPKLNFGLDLLYGQDQQRSELEQGFDADSNVTVFGKVKRRF